MIRVSVSAQWARPATLPSVTCWTARIIRQVVQNLALTLSEEYMYRRLILVWGAMIDKDIVAGLTSMLPLVDTFILTRPEGERSAEPEQLQACLPEKARHRGVLVRDVAAALREAGKLGRLSEDMIAWWPALSISSGRYDSCLWVRWWKCMGNDFALDGVDEAVIRAERAKARELRKSRWWQQKTASGLCHYCGRKYAYKELTMDHLVPLARGGRSTRR
ncbi:MAG: HNH endonuclease [Deltaproteobacteria bacterium]|nr:HNH endonuclease [Deltaproteobacteria bacterium]